MARLTFMGGIHTYEGKELSKDKPTTVLLPKGDLVFPLSQHIGAPAKPLVSKGDVVSVGQMIAEADGYISSNIISSVSGTVKAIERRLTATGKMEESIVITNDNEYKKIEGYGQSRDYTKMSKEKIREAVKDAGIVGLGGAGFPTHVKLTPKDDSKIDYVIVNGAECEPYLTYDYRLMLEEPQMVIEGLKIILQLFDNAKGIIGIEDNKPDVIEKFKELTAADSKIEVQALKTKYPQGGERQLVYVTTGRKLNSKKLPADVGCIVNNVATVAAIYKAVAKSTPLTNRIVTISGDAVAEPQNFNVPFGMSFSEIAQAAGGFKAQPKKLVFGGPMMGHAMYSYDVPVTKTANSLLGFVKDESAVEESPCIQCGRCYFKCPLNLLPMKLQLMGLNNEDEKFLQLGGMECCGCGCCSFICPANRSLTQTIVQTKQRIIEKRNEEHELHELHKEHAAK
ncbi:MAG: electron transport complex subunit RsxC [Clostridiales bacterium]|jgi:electron transport complex protein RnfC|nr:electron transport complex subunit RsxC [Clostridiales bacterium]